MLLLCLTSISLATAQTTTSTKTISVKGYVTTQNGEPLSGVSISVKGKGEGFSTQVDGSFQVTVPENTTLEFSYVGYIKKELKTGTTSQSGLTIQLVANKNELDQVVVVGYGTRKKADVTGSITSVSAQSLQDVPAGNIIQALQGQGAGIDIQKSGGNSKPGSTPSILIRGTRSVQATNSPLIVIDGIPYDGNLNDFNLDDAVSVDVLKDASSTAIYGSRGANGVILITTKRGKPGMRKPVISYSAFAGVNKVFEQYPMMNGEQYALLKKWAYYLGRPGNYTGINDPKIIADAFSPQEQESLLKGRSTNWQDLIYKNGIMTNHQLSVMGGTDITQYALSGSYYNEGGVHPGQSFERYTLKLSLDQQLGKAVKLGVSSLNSYSVTQGEGANPMGQALRASPLAYPYDSTGALINDFVSGSSNQVWNPLGNFIQGAAVQKRKRLATFNSLYAEITLLKGLKYKFNAGVQIRSDSYGDFYATKTTYSLGTPSNASNRSGFNSDYLLENILTYDKVIANRHRINFTGLYSFENNVSQSTQLDYTNLQSDNAQYFNPALGTNYTASGSRGEWSLISYMARVNYSFDDKYMLTLTARTDGSSRLAEGNKYKSFPSAAVAWNMHKENFLRSATAITNLKLRASYGSVGNTSINPYQTLGGLTTQVYNYGGTTVTGLYPNSAPNPTLGWEYTATLNAGIDFGLWQNRITGSVEYYHAWTSEMILPQSLPATSGIPNRILTNIGKSENEGIDIRISTVNIQSKSNRGITWSSDFNFFINRGKITQLNPSLNTLIDGKPADLGNNWFVGRPIGSYYDFERIGIWQATAKDTALAKSLGLTTTGVNSVIGQIRVADRNGDSKIDNSDMYILGSQQPSWEGGTTQRVSYRNFDFTLVAFARVGGTISSSLFGAGFANTLQGSYNNVNIPYWTPDNPTNDWPKANSAQTNPQRNSTLRYYDGSFLKIRSLTLGYSVPPQAASRLGLKTIRFYATAKDPFILFSPYRNKYHGIDPESAGTLNVDTPATWSMVFGVNITL